MREMILKAVANPPKILWGPVNLVMINLGLQFPMLFMVVGTFNINPLIFLVSILVGHVACIAIGAREPHASSMLMAFGQASKKTTNLYKVKGNKFAP